MILWEREEAGRLPGLGDMARGKQVAAVEARQAEETVEDQGLDLDLRTSDLGGHFPTPRLLVVTITGLDIPISGGPG